MSGSITEYSPILIRNIDDIKRDARSNLLKTAKVSRSYHIGQINATSNFLRPNSASAKFVTEVCQQEEMRIQTQRRLLRKAKSQSMDRPPRQLDAMSRTSTQMSAARPAALSDAESFTFDVFEEIGNVDSPTAGSRPLSGMQDSPKAGSRPLSGYRSLSGMHRPASGKSDRPASGKSDRPASGKSSGKLSPTSMQQMHSFQDGKSNPKQIIPISKSKSFETRPKLSKEEKEQTALAKIEEKRLRVFQKQLDIETKERQVMWLTIIAHFCRTG